MCMRACSMNEAGCVWVDIAWGTSAQGGMEVGWIGLAVDTKEESPALPGVWIYSGVPGPPCQAQSAPSGGHGEDGPEPEDWGWGWGGAGVWGLSAW